MNVQQGVGDERVVGGLGLLVTEPRKMGLVQRRDYSLAQSIIQARCYIVYVHASEE